MSTDLLEPGFIPRALTLPRGQDYAFLRRRGLHRIERLAHSAWTDYNVHDPGVTILELLCYAITDVALRAAYPMRDLLARQIPTWRAPSAYAPGVIVAYGEDTYRCLVAHTSAAGLEPANAPQLWTIHRDFHLAHEILVSRPVSFDDLRRRLIDLPGVRNAWIERHRDVKYFVDVAHAKLTSASMPETIELNGLYNVYLEYEDGVQDGNPAYRQQAALGLATATGDDYVNTQYKGLEFRTAEDARLDSVTVYPEAPGTVVIRLLDGGREIARKQQVVTATKTAVSVPLDFPLDAGALYRLDATGSTVKLHRTPSVVPLPRPGNPVQILRGYASGSTPAAGSQFYYFFYDWKVSHDSAGFTKHEVRAAAIERIHAHRNLCEDVINVCDLVPEDVAICADIELRPDADTNAVEAEILYRVYQYVSPAVGFYSLEELEARGKTIDEIFDGPLLDHGFIDGDELAAIKRRCELHVSDIIGLIMGDDGVDGVVAVRSLKLLKRSDRDHPQDWILPLSSDRFRIASFAAFDDPASVDRFGSKLTFYKRGLPYYANRKDVEPLYKQKKAADIERKLTLRQQTLAVPQGVWRDVAAYEPIQNELPAVYRVGRTYVPDREPVAQALSRQLTAYLTFFDQLLANYVAQLSHAGDLFTWRDVDFRTYFTQALTGIQGLDPPGALDGSRDQDYPSFSTAVAEMAETSVRAGRRRLEMLEHLVARYAEQFDDYIALMRPFLRAAFDRLPAWVPGTLYAEHAHVKDDGAEWECISPVTAGDAGTRPKRLPTRWRQSSRLITQLRRFLQDYPALSANRGGAFDWRWPEIPANVAGYQHRVYRMLDINPVERRELAGHRFVILDVSATTTPAWCFELEDDNGFAIFRSIECSTKSSIEALLDLALRLGSDETNWTMAGATHRLVQHCEENDEDDAIGDIVGGGVLADVIAYFKRVFEAEGFHLIEHILLRLRTTRPAAVPENSATADAYLPIQVLAEDDCCPPVRDPYSFRMSIVLPSWSPRFRNMKFRQMVEDTLRREAPAHVYPRICWVNHEQMKNLEVALEDWQERLAWLSHEAGACDDTDQTRTGRLPLPPRTSDDDLAYEASLKGVIAALYGLTNVYPLAQLHDCEETDGEVPQVTLGNTSLGTL